jgi:hypothetical protein
MTGKKAQPLHLAADGRHREIIDLLVDKRKARSWCRSLGHFLNHAVQAVEFLKKRDGPPKSL